jgi:hypothetical protein
MPSRMLREMDAAGRWQLRTSGQPGLVEQAAVAVRKDPVLRRIAERGARGLE